jgi:hypothetical protein
MPVLDAAAAGQSPRTPSKTSPDPDTTSTGSSNLSDPVNLPEGMTQVNWKDRISTLHTEAKQLRAQRNRVSKDLKSAMRKNKRIMERAKGLSEVDIVQILVMKRAKTASALGATSSGDPSVNVDARESTSAAAIAASGDDVAADAEL